MRDLPTLLSGWRAVREGATPGPWCANKYGGIGGGPHGINPQVITPSGIEPFWEAPADQRPINRASIVLHHNISAALAAVVEAAAVVDASLDLPKTEYSGPEWAALKMNRDALSALHALLDQEVPQ